MLEETGLPYRAIPVDVTKMVMVHVYFAIRPEELYMMRSMLRGWITREEFEQNHHPELWDTADQE